MNYICKQCKKQFKNNHRRKFCSFTCYTKFNQGKNHWAFGKKRHDMSGAKNPNWIGGKVKDQDGYVLIVKKDHPLANNQGYVREHRLIMEESLGRFLYKSEVVHHKNGVKDDNRFENLVLYKNNNEHIKGHKFKGRNSPAWKGGISKIEKKCLFCKKIFWANAGNVKQGFGKFCSKRCKGRFYAPIINIHKKLSNKDLSLMAKSRKRDESGRFK